MPESTKGSRLTQGILLISAVLAGVWYMIDLSAKLWPKHSESASIASNKSGTDKGLSIKDVNNAQEDGKQVISDSRNESSPTIQPGKSSARYENISVVRKEGTRQAAIILWEQEGADSLLGLESAISESIAARGIKPVQSFFTPAFIRDGKASRLISGEWNIAKELDIGRHVAYVLGGLVKVSYVANENSPGLLTANLAFEFRCLDAVTTTICGTQSFAVPGAGFTREDALASAVEHFKPQLETQIGAWFH